MCDKTKTMCVFINIVVCQFFIFTLAASLNLEQYLVKRNKLIKYEIDASVGGNITLNPEEKKVNELLLKLKNETLNKVFENPSRFRLRKNFDAVRNEIQNSTIYKVLKLMPKGALLHIHSSFIMDAEYLLKLTYYDDLFVCFYSDELKFLFSADAPQRPCLSGWHRLRDRRQQYNNVNDFDRYLKSKFSLYYDESEDINTIWNRFERIHDTKSGLLSYKPVFEQYFYDSLKKIYDDNIFYVEIRTGLKNLYDLNGTRYDSMAVLQLYKQITERFKNNYPDFIGAKIIYSKYRKINTDSMKQFIDTAIRLKEKYPDILAGIDLVGQEDLGKPLLDYVPYLHAVKDKLNFYFHAGETNWYGMPTDENLVDAIMLGTKRIGHGYALMKHPRLLEAVRNRDIAIEVNVVSNKVLGLVSDIRNHPLSLYLALGLPVVISSDDPGVWGAAPLTDDFYTVFMGVSSKHSDLQLLKQLALNSIKYSSMNDLMKQTALDLFEDKWRNFTFHVLKTLV